MKLAVTCRILLALGELALMLIEFSRSSRKCLSYISWRWLLQEKKLVNNGEGRIREICSGLKRWGVYSEIGKKERENFMCSVLR
jgi:hypothetical protein